MDNLSNDTNVQDDHAEDKLTGSAVDAWCQIMLSLMSLTSYSSGRVGARWRNAFVG